MCDAYACKCLTYFICRCVRSCICMRSCVHVCVRACIRACMRKYVHTYVRSCVRACVRSNKIDVRLDEIDTYAREESDVSRVACKVVARSRWRGT